MTKKMKIIIALVSGIVLMGVGLFWLATREFNDISLAERAATDAALVAEIVSTHPNQNEPVNVEGDEGNADNTTAIGGPSIEVLTEFPEGETTEIEIDIVYEAIPSKGAGIVEVYYTINDFVGNTRYLYERAYDSEEELGHGRVVMIPEENKIVFTVKDTNGRTAQYVVENEPYVVSGEFPPYDPEDALPSKLGGDIEYLPDRIVFSTVVDVPYEEAVEMAEYINGEIIGALWSAHDYCVRVPESSEEELEALCEKLEKKYGDQLTIVYLYYLGGVWLDSL